MRHKEEFTLEEYDLPIEGKCSRVYLNGWHNRDWEIVSGQILIKWYKVYKL